LEKLEKNAMDKVAPLMKMWLKIRVHHDKMLISP
jgi:hypothetical protein